MNNKTTILFTGTLLIIGLLGEVLGIRQFGYYTQLAIGLGRLGGIILLLQQGTLIKTRPFFQLILFFLGIATVGALFTIQGWPYNNIILVTGLLGVPTIYTIRFIKKQDKERLDFLKILWVSIFYIGTTFKLEHWPLGKELISIEGFLFLIMFLDFANQQFRTGKQNDRNTSSQL